MLVNHKKMTGDGIVCDRPCLLVGYLVGTDGVNDPTVTLFDDNKAATGNEVVPTNTYDASLLGSNGASFGFGVVCNKGLWCEIALAAGAVEVVVYYV